MTTTTTSTPLHDYLCRIAGGYVPKAEVAEVTRLATETLKAERDALLAMVRRTAKLHPNDICGVAAAELLAQLEAV